MLRSALLVFIFQCVIVYNTFGQECNFQPPVTGTIISSGSYGEPRTAHFHAGIDFKQKRGIPYDTIYAVASGYVSRIVIRPDGYGNALYIDHPCGKTSVYAHLYEFAPQIANYARKLMYDQRSYTLNHVLKENQIQISQNQPIGVMGSTGRSSGPHLHFEIRNTQSEKSTNPALYGLKPHDDIKPVIRGILLYTLTPDGQELAPQYYPAHLRKNGEYELSNFIINSGSLLVGIGIHTYDTMNGARNHNGIYAAELKVDGTSEFRFRLDSISFDASQYLHSHLDYQYKVTNRYVTKLFKNPGNPLQIYQTQGDQGEIQLFDYRTRQIEIRVFDIDRNRSSLKFGLRRNNTLQPFTINKFQEFDRITPKESFTKTGQHTKIQIPENAVTAPVFLKLDSDYSDSIVLKQTIDIPIFNAITIEQKITDRKNPKEKYILASTNKDDELQRHNCNWKNDTTMTCKVFEMENYTVAIDTIPPVISIISLPNTSRKNGIISITDNFNPTSSADAIKFNVYLNDRWILCQHDIKTHRVWWDMDDLINMDNIQIYQLKVEATDRSGNTTSLNRTFTR